MFGLDATLKKVFPLVVGAMTLTAAYFQATGLTTLVGASILPRALPTQSSRPTPRQTPVPLSADVVLARNVFDSVTGPIVPGAGSADPAPAPPPAPALCEKGWVSLITLSDDPWLSFASVGTGREDAALVRVGDPFAEATVTAIHWNRVWLEGSPGACYLELGERSKPPAKVKRRARSKKRKKTKAQQEIAERIEKVGPHHYQIDRSAIDMMLQGSSSLRRVARVVKTKDGQALRINSRVRRTALAELGFEAGDRIHSINGLDMSNPEEALASYQRLQTANNLVVELQRGGKPVQLEFDVK